VRKHKSFVIIIVNFVYGKEVMKMWISKKKFNQMMLDAVEKEREREMMYRFMEETHTTNRKLEDSIYDIRREVEDLKQIVRDTRAGKKQLNG
jgi:hypothetical protein